MKTGIMLVRFNNDYLVRAASDIEATFVALKRNWRKPCYQGPVSGEPTLEIIAEESMENLEKLRIEARAIFGEKFI